MTDSRFAKSGNLSLSLFLVVPAWKDFLNLGSHQAEQWISRSEIAISPENDVIKIIIKWIEQCRSERQGKLQELFRHKWRTGICVT